jgi:hypothetical protein
VRYVPQAGYHRSNAEAPATTTVSATQGGKRDFGISSRARNLPGLFRSDGG